MLGRDEVARIVLAGEGGQGVQSVAAILSEAAYNEGREVLYIPNFGVEQRGGVSVAFVQVADNRIAAMKFPKADIVVALSGRAVARTKQYCNEKTLFIYDKAADALPEDFPEKVGRLLPVAATETVKHELKPVVLNVFVMGVVLGATDVFNMDKVKESLEENLGRKFAKNPQLRTLNFAALAKGYSAARGLD